MNKGFPYLKLKELCDVNQGLQIPIDERYTEPGENRFFYITVQFLKDSHLNKFYVKNPPLSSICNDDDILIVRTGSTGQIVTGVSGCFHNNFFKVNYNKELINGRYLYHCLNTKEKYKDMLRRAGVTTIPDLNHFMFLDMEIPVPPKNIQIQISKTLDSLDLKIELNNRINLELEGMAKLLYDYWFVQFDFPNAEGKPYKSSGGKMVWNAELKREVPEGWGEGNLSCLGEIIGGSTPPREIEEYFTNNGTAWITPKDLSINTGNKFITKGELDVSDKGIRAASLNIMPAGTILLSSRAPIGYLAIAREPVTTNQGFKSFVLCKGYSREFVYYTIKNMIPTIENNAVGSTFKEVSASTIKTIPICLPDNNILKKYTETVQPIFKRQDKLELENQQLSSLRDWLLPMLMNGQVSIKN